MNRHSIGLVLVAILSIGAQVAQADRTGAISRDEFDEYAEILTFDADQKSAALSLFEVYSIGISNSAATYHTRMDEAVRKAIESGTSGADPLRQKIVQEFASSTASLERSLFVDVKALIKEPSETLWNHVLSARKRHTCLQHFMMRFQQVDLIQLWRQYGKESPESKVILKEWEEGVVRLIDRNEVVRSAYSAYLESGQAVVDGRLKKLDDDPRARDMLQNTLDISIETGDLTNRCSKRLAALLALEDRVRFCRHFFESGYPVEFSVPKAEAANRALLLDTRLSEDSREGLSQLLDSHLEGELRRYDEIMAASKTRQEIGQRRAIAGQGDPSEVNAIAETRRCVQALGKDRQEWLDRIERESLSLSDK